MCRLLGYVAARPIAVVDVLGVVGLDAFTSLAAVHGDGWGMAWHDTADGATRSVAEPQSAARDRRYAELARRPLGSAGLVHLRWATGGLPIARENTHPFTDDGYAFAHNGHIEPIGRLERLLSPTTRAKLVGATDSERYFRLLVQSIDEHNDEARGVAHGLSVLMHEFPDASLNALLLSPSRLFAIHINGRARSPQAALRALVGSEEAMPHRHGTEYYAMDYRVTEDAVHVISSGLDEEGWSRIPADTVAMIDLETREVKRLDLHRNTPARSERMDQ